MGFFSPPNSELLYLGIWYTNNGTGRSIVWVANRDSPLNTSTGFLNLTADGNLAIIDSLGKVPWSTNTSNISNPVVQLLDTGNLVLTGGHSHNMLWQSFDYPFNTLLSGMRIGIDFATNFNWYLTSWKSSTDPSPGKYSYKLDPSGVSEFFLYQNTSPLFRSGPWDGHGFSGQPQMAPVPGVVFSFILNQSEIYYSFQVLNHSLTAILVLNEIGELQRYIYEYANPGWKLLVEPLDVPCDDYAACGANGVCVLYSTVCQCLQGFEPRNTFNWNSRDFVDGCVRKTALDCLQDGFLELLQVKLPDTANATSYNMTSEECHDYCLKSCSCSAYAPTDSGCITWTGDLLDLRLFDEGGDFICFRVPSSDLPSNAIASSSKNLAVIIVTSVIGFVILVCAALLFWKKYMRRNKGALSISMYMVNLLQ